MHKYAGRRLGLLSFVLSASKSEVWRDARIVVDALVSSPADLGLTPDTGS